MDSSDDRRDETHRDESQEDRALRALGAIFSGGDMTEETARLANEFTDRQSSRFSGWFARRHSPRNRAQNQLAAQQRDETSSFDDKPCG